MIEALKSNETIREMGGRFKFTALVQHRWRELLNGSRPLIERQGRSDLELAIEEVTQGKISIDYENSDITPPDRALE